MIINVDQKIINNQNVSIINVENSCGLKACFMSLGAAFYSLSLRKSNGDDVQVLIAPEDYENYYHDDFYFGKSIGRVAGRIDKGSFKFEGNEYKLAKNWNNISFLHGGPHGTSTQNFEYGFLMQNKYMDISFKHKVLENNDGIPGNINLEVVYRVYDKENKIFVFFNYIANRSTIASFTNHASFNLNGKGNILHHKLYLNASKFGDVNDELIAVKTLKCNKVMDFSSLKEIGQYIEDESLQAHTSKGYDHPYLLDSKNSDEVAAILVNEDESIKLTMSTSYPALVIYTNNYPYDWKNTNGEMESKYNGICLEPSFFPNCINNKNASTVMIEGKKLYNQIIEYNFEVK